jgi:hypothetical protein
MMGHEIKNDYAVKGKQQITVLFRTISQLSQSVVNR